MRGVMFTRDDRRMLSALHQCWRNLDQARYLAQRKSGQCIELLSGLTEAPVQSDQLLHRILDELTKALSLDQNLLPALSSRALVYFNLKQFQQAVQDYDRVLILSPTDYVAYNDRALAKMQLGKMYDAISD